MITDRNRIRCLLEKYASKEATTAEETELFEIVNQVKHDNHLQREVTMIFEEMEPVYLTKIMRERILAKIGLTTSPQTPPHQERGLETPKFRRISPVRRVTVAASIILMLGVGVYFLFFNKTGKQNEIVKTIVPNDIKAPDNNRAVITLDNGEKVFLDSIGNGTLAEQGNVNVVKTADGKIVYNGTAPAGTEVMYNTIYNPRGSKVVSLKLSDGTQVWLNSESSLRYPTVFIGDERKVAITGEAYFEVAHDTNKPFTVNKNETYVQVLGTHFNVNAYEDEKDIKVTLLKGSVKVIKGSSSSLLAPGQQASVASDIKIVRDVDIDEVLAWKNGKFQFGEAADIKTIMRQIARWYDLDVEYEGTVTEHIGGTISRDVNVTKVFEMLKMTGSVKFKVNGKKVIVMPQKK